MSKRGWLYISLTALAGGLSATEACILERSGTCEEPGGCLREEDGGGAGPGGAGVGGGSAASCESHAGCEDGNPCTIDTCDVSGVCRRSDMGTGEVVGGTACLPLICEGGGPAEEPALAGMPCDGGTCDGAGACQPPLAVGDACEASAQCESGFCVEGACCAYACDGECDRCNLDTFDYCEKHMPNDHDPDCGPSTVCGGDGKCKPAGN